MCNKKSHSANLDDILTVNKLKKNVRDFCEKRDWDKFHNAKDLAIALSIEASELLEIFRWKNKDEVKEIFKDKKGIEMVRDELSDVLFFALRLAQKYEIDISSSLLNKIEKNKKNIQLKNLKVRIKSTTKFKHMEG